MAIIHAGRKTLAAQPRADMPQFRLVSQVEIDQEAKYQSLLETEAATRRAIAAGKKRLEAEASGRRSQGR